jgi:ATP-dependent DNA ligase
MGIVAKRKDLPYESGRSRRWIKIKNPDSPAMKRVEDGTF